MKRWMVLGLTLLLLMLASAPALAQDGVTMATETVTVPVDYTPIMIIAGVGYALLFLVLVGAYMVFKPSFEQFVASFGALGEQLAASVPEYAVQAILSMGYQATQRLPGTTDDDIYNAFVREMGYQVVIGADGVVRFERLPIEAQAADGVRAIPQLYKWADGTLARFPEPPPNGGTEIVADEATPHA